VLFAAFDADALKAIHMETELEGGILVFLISQSRVGLTMLQQLLPALDIHKDFQHRGQGKT